MCIEHSNSQYILKELMAACNLEKLSYQMDDVKLSFKGIESDLPHAEFHYIQIGGIKNSNAVNRLLFEPIKGIAEDIGNVTDDYGYSEYEICLMNERILSVRYDMAFGSKAIETATVNIDLQTGKLIGLSQLKLEKTIYNKIRAGEFKTVGYFKSSENETLESILSSCDMDNGDLAELFKRGEKRFYIKNDVIGIIINSGWYVAKDVTLEFDMKEE